MFRRRESRSNFKPSRHVEPEKIDADTEHGRAERGFRCDTTAELLGRANAKPRRPRSSASPASVPQRREHRARRPPHAKTGRTPGAAARRKRPRPAKTTNRQSGSGGYGRRSKDRRTFLLCGASQPFVRSVRLQPDLARSVLARLAFEDVQPLLDQRLPWAVPVPLGPGARELEIGRRRLCTTRPAA